MKVKTSELAGAALDWAASKADGLSFTSDGISILVEKKGRLQILGPCTTGQGIQCGHSPSTDWSVAGPIIEREKIYFREEKPGLYFGFIWNGTVYRNLSDGPSPLVAAMRCFVVAKLGNEMDVPAELLQTPGHELEQDNSEGTDRPGARS